jgi:hypothetical protein
MSEYVNEFTLSMFYCSIRNMMGTYTYMIEQKEICAFIQHDWWGR